MWLCLDVGNATLCGGVFVDDQLCLQFRYPTAEPLTSDQLGVFLRQVLRENELDPRQLQRIALCCVVPSLEYTVRATCIKYFRLEPFVLKPGAKTGLKIRCPQPQEVGSDRIANAVAALQLAPAQPIMVVDVGIATTLDAISAQAEYLGGAILPGVKSSMQALVNQAAKLSAVPIIPQPAPLGQTTCSNLQSGLYHGHVGAIRYLLQKISHNAFPGQTVHVIGTGDFVSLFEAEALFDQAVPSLTLLGLRLLLSKNPQTNALSSG